MLAEILITYIRYIDCTLICSTFQVEIFIRVNVIMFQFQDDYFFHLKVFSSFWKQMGLFGGEGVSIITIIYLRQYYFVKIKPHQMIPNFKDLHKRQIMLLLRSAYVALSQMASYIIVYSSLHYTVKSKKYIFRVD